MLNVVIFAAGRGTRLDACLPKFLVGIGSQPVFEHQLQAMRHLHAQIYIVCGFRAPVLCHLVLEDAQLRKNLTFIYNDDYEQSQVVSIRAPRPPRERDSLLQNVLREGRVGLSRRDVDVPSVETPIDLPAVLRGVRPRDRVPGHYKCGAS